MIRIRPFQPSDTEQIARLFHETIRSVNKKDYSKEQVKAWAPDDIHFRDWEAMCSSKYTLVADAAETVVGFAQLEDDGHIDCFYCHKDFQGQGIGLLLFKGIEEEARRQNLTRLFVEASITARPFFEKMGFERVEKQRVAVRGTKLTNFRMEKIF